MTIQETLEVKYNNYKLESKNLVINSDLTILEKLECLKDYHIFNIESYLTSFFQQTTWYSEFEEELKSLNITYPIIDETIVSNSDRHQIIYWSNYVESLLEDLEDGETTRTILTNRTNKLVKKADIKELIDAIYNFVIENETIGFEIDW